MDRRGSVARGSTDGKEIETYQPTAHVETDGINLGSDLIDLINNAGSNSKTKWDLDTKVMAAAYYTVLGSYEKTTKHMAAAGKPVPKSTIAYWRTKTNWWQPLIEEVRKAKNEELDAKLTSIIHKSADELEDRVKNGNYKLSGKKKEDGTPEYVRVPMSSSELAKDGIGIQYDKRALIRGDPTSRVAREDPEVILEKIAKNLIEMSQPKPIEAVKTEYTVEDENSCNQ